MRCAIWAAYHYKPISTKNNHAPPYRPGGLLGQHQTKKQKQKHNKKKKNIQNDYILRLSVKTWAMSADLMSVLAFPSSVSVLE